MKPFEVYERVGADCYHSLKTPELLSPFKLSKKFLEYEVRMLLNLNNVTARSNSGVYRGVKLYLHI
jgi:hypothetical protein